jgi:hypothetical protein
VKAEQYAKAGIPFCWRVEQAHTSTPTVCIALLDPATRTYRNTEAFAGVVTISAPFTAEIDLRHL